MKLVYIYKSFANKAGMERILSDKMNYFVRNCGYDITFITYEQGTHSFPYALDKRIKVIDLNTRFVSIYRYNNILRIIKGFSLKVRLKKRLADVLYKEKPHVVVCTTYDFNISECILDLPYKFVVESHTFINDILSVKSYNNVILRNMVKKIDNWHYSKINKAKTLVTLTKADKKDFEKNISINIKIIPNMITYYPTEITPYHKRQNRIICVGRLHQQKGFDLMIEAWALIAKKYPTWKVDIFGHGDLRNNLQKQISDNNLCDSIKIHNPTDKIYDEYMNSSIYALSSRFEGFGLVLIEAMSCGIPCVSFDCPNGPSEIITHREEGLLVPPENVLEYAKALEWMINNKEEREKMSRKARKSALKYTYNNIMPQWEKMFETIASI